jgi:glycosyltransferase involved in cell wall biosynthesis
MKFLFIWAESARQATGGTSHLKGLLAGLQAVGCDVCVLLPSYRGQDRTIADSRLTYVPLPPRNIFSFLLLQILVIVLLPYWLIKYRPDVVYVRTCFFMFLMVPFCRLFGIPLVAEVDAIVDEEMGVRGEGRIRAKLVGKLDRINYRCVDALACVTQGIRDEVVRRGGHPDHTVHIPNATLPEVMQPVEQAAAREQLKLPKNDYLIGFAGSMAAWQGFDLLVCAAKQVISKLEKPIRFALMGHGACRTELEKLIAENGLSDHFMILPPGPPEKVCTFFSACDALLITVYDPRTLRYGLSSLKFWDATSIGIPILVPRGAGLSEVLEYLDLPGTYNDGDADDLARLILEVIPNTEMYQQNRQKTHQLVAEKYSWTQVAEKLIDLCGKLKKS